MLKLKTLTIRNFLSMGNVTQAIRLDDHGLSLVLGHNSDSNGGVTKNGAGKTSIVQAISYALYGQPITKIKADNLVNNINQKGMLVTVEFESNGVDYRIERGRKPNVLKFFVNGSEYVEDISLGENRQTQEQIDNILGMSFILFSHIVLNTTSVMPFLRLRAADQREVSEELLGVTQISQRAETLKKLIGTTKALVQQEEANIRAAQGVNERVLVEIAQITTKRDRWDIDHNNHVEELAGQIKELSIIDFDAEKKTFDRLDAWNAHQRDLESKLQVHIATLNSVTDQLHRAEKDLAAAKSQDPTASFALASERTKKEIERKEAEIKRQDAEAKRLEGVITGVQAKIDNPGEHHCVTCDQPLEGTDHIKSVMANLEAEMERLVVQFDAAQTIADDIKAEIEELKAEEAKSDETNKAAHWDWLKRVDKLDEWRDELKMQDAKVKEDIRNAKDGMTSDEDKPQTIFRSRDELYSTKHLLDTCVQQLEAERAKTNPHDPHLKSLQGTMQEIDYDEINRLAELLKHQDFLMKLLTNKDSFVRKKIIDQNLYYLNTRLAFYLEKLGLPHEVIFMNDLTTEIMLLGRDYDFEQLSRGEMNRVIMAVSWAFRDVWESLNHTVNLVWVDELIDNGLDSQGAEAALSIMKSFSRHGKNVFLISHRDELVGRIDRTLLVAKDNGFTTITEEVA